jgi:5-oxoprolinase (ATP-hydrolysing)
MKSKKPERAISDLTGFRFSIDRGGTFTDVYAEVPGDPGFRVVKLLSEDPDNYPDAPTEGIRRIIEDVTGEPLAKDRLLPTDRIDWIRMGTTVATNALLERQGARCALVVTRGFKDILQIGNQDRPEIFDLKIHKPDLLYETVVEVDERLRILGPEDAPPAEPVVEGITGDRLAVTCALDPDAVKLQLQRVYDTGIHSLAVVLMHAYAWPGHEQAIGCIAKELGFTQISLSSRVMPRVKLVARGDTTLVDAYLNPHIRLYLESFRKGFSGGFSGGNLFFMQSDGGLASADGFTGSRAILSGPAGGVAGYAASAFHRESGQPVIGFDMGGTSTDVSRYGGEFELVFESETAGVRIQAPQLHIKTVAAGGGSRLFFENNMFRVGPESAGADPGPACYRKNGYPTVTDANLVIGRIQPAYFPKIFGPGKNRSLDKGAARRAMSKLADDINTVYREKGSSPLTLEDVALGFVRVADETMVRPIREISVMRGFDIKNHVLAAFGGAGPQHACSIARSLGINRIFIHRFSGILSACGMGMADVVVERQKPSSAVYGQNALPGLEKEITALEQECMGKLHDQGFAEDDIDTVSFLNLRYDGTDTAVMVARPEDGDDIRVFKKMYLREYGFDLKGRRILVDDVRVRARGHTAGLRRTAIFRATGPPAKKDTVPCYFESGWTNTALYDLESLGAGHHIPGPAIIIHDTTTIVVEPGCRAEITEHGDVAIDVGDGKRNRITTAVDPVRLTIFSHLFMSIAEQMGRMLEKTAISTNIKERLDFSCALFGPDGELVANAPHLPVHLGAMSAAVKAQIRLAKGALKPNDVLVSNHPDTGGSHLPDITVITPVFKDGGIIFWTAVRGHHADIGGISPGSMPPDSRRIEEEGACIRSFKLVENGRFNESGIRELLEAPGNIKPAPGRPAISGARRINDNISDLKAQGAACRKGIALVLEMVDRYGLDVVQAYMDHVQDAAEDAVRSRLKDLSQRKNMAEVDTVCATDHLDDGSPIALALTIDRRTGTAVFDFAGTGPQVPGNCNAPSAVTHSAVLYCLRCLIEKDLPLNNGCLIPITIHIPPKSLLAPSDGAAVVGGNVLTSQRIVDVVLKAFGVAAASQGCMNNFTFGNETFGYYETMGGGAGAGPGWHGQSGVHTHMTNTRITDPEILERRYPVILREFSIRRESGGRGRFNGGDGLIREIEFLTPLRAAILSERRVYAPYGLDGGHPGKRGKNLLIQKDGRTVDLGAKNEIRAKPGDRIRIMTPGGGGYGVPEPKNRS